MLLVSDDNGSWNIVDSGGGCLGGNMGYDALVVGLVLVFVVVVVVVVVVMMEVMEHSRF